MKKSFFDRIDLKKRYPNYIHKNIFRFFLFLMLAVVVVDFVLNDYSVINFSYSCESVNGCLNPFYECAPGEYLNCNPDVPEWACVEGLCEMQSVPFGFSVGRDDFLARNGSWLLWLLLPAAFLVNHLYYVWKVRR